MIVEIVDDYGLLWMTMDDYGYKLLLHYYYWIVDDSGLIQCADRP